MIEDLESADLIVDEEYGGSRKGNAGDDPLPALLGVDSGAGFRHLGKRPGIDTLKLLVLKSSFKDPDWPDGLDSSTGIFTYYGDNKRVSEIHDTPRQGNQILRNLFDGAHNPNIHVFPVILLFGNTGVYRDVRFLGLAVPGAASVEADYDLIAVWRSKGVSHRRFQNYKAIFTVLDVPVVSRNWIDDIKLGNAISSPHAPKTWLDWIRFRKYKSLMAPRTLEVRDKKSQLPSKSSDSKILSYIHNRYSPTPTEFEKCAMELAKLMMPSIESWDLTRPWRDGGRDAIGVYELGSGASSILVEFAMEAKCHRPNSGVKVKHLSRLISRLRHRQFGILVTTSYLASQAYKELKEDKHPVVVISGIDIVRILRERIGSEEQIKHWIEAID